MFYDLLNATVLFLGTTIAVVSMSRVMLSMAKGSVSKKTSEGNFRSQAQAAVIAAIRRGDITADTGRAPRASRVPPVIYRTGYTTTVQRDVEAANQPRWLPARRRCAGYTLPELLTCLTVVGVIAGMSVPGMTGLMLDTRAKTAAVDVYTTMVFARSEAIKRNTTVDVVPNGGAWRNGWTVQVGGTVLKTVAPATSGLDDITAPATLSYGGDGRLTDPGTITYVIAVTGNPNVVARRVIVDTSGRASIRQGLS